MALSIAGVALIMISSLEVYAGQLKVRNPQPGYVGMALMLEVFGLGLQEKSQDT